MTTPAVTVREWLDEHGTATNVYCGCIGWVSGHPRVTRGMSAPSPKGTRTYYRCDECRRCWHTVNRESRPS
jgi:hypothetical protein